MFDEYLSGLGERERGALRRIIEHVRQLVPQAEEGRSYGLPAFRYRGQPLLGFSARKEHLSLYPFSSSVVASVKEDLAGYETSKGTVRFTVERPIPDDKVTLLVQQRITEIDG